MTIQKAWETYVRNYQKEHPENEYQVEMPPIPEYYRLGWEAAMRSAIVLLLEKL